ncbi:ubiquitin-like protein Pup [Buchananella felis]|uniref:ubiquitin-like protein Pup n=1 Tax=Buchananella felis TaxID=3231492 RepID=UPI0035281A40
MSEQTFAGATAGSGEEEAQAALRPQAKDVDLDALLDDIDAVLATDAQAFVQGFVQKGGQ